MAKEIPEDINKRIRKDFEGRGRHQKLIDTIILDNGYIIMGISKSGDYTLFRYNLKGNFEGQLTPCPETQMSIMRYYASKRRY